MKIRSAVAFALLSLLLLQRPFGTETPAAADECGRGMTMLAKAYLALGAMTASFQQTLDAKALNQRETESGTLFLAQGGRMRWQYDRPAGKLAVSDGRKTYLYIPEERQVFVQPLDTGPLAPVTLRLLLGKVDVAKEFSCESAAESDGSVTLKLALKEALAGVQDLEVRLNEKTSLVDRVAYKDALGNSITLELSNIKTGTALDPALFQFQPPKGVEVIQGGAS
jgi:outer membrane lipoprotein carrier protein